VEECACRELLEETNIRIEMEEMKNAKVGIQSYTFEHDPVKMITHVFHINLTNDREYQVAGCEEITPTWYDDIYMIPLDNMFADDSLWLTTLLSSKEPLAINGSYHFQENCQETNTILHYCMEVQPRKMLLSAGSTTCSYSMEQRLFHALHDNRIHSPSIKEFKECYAFCNGVRKVFAKHRRKNSHQNSESNVDVVIDVAGGHGALAALFLICTSALKAVVIDPADVGGGSVQRAWVEFIGDNKILMYRRECLRTGLPAELDKALKTTTHDRLLVVACHACQHLSEEVLDISCRYGVHCAVMPCCQKDLSEGATWKAASKNLSVPVAFVMDLLLCGKMMALGSYDVRMKCIDPQITPQNRIIVCRRLSVDDVDSVDKRKSAVDKAHAKIELVYRKAHGVTPSRKYISALSLTALMESPSLCYLALGFAAGAILVGAFRKR
jgi:hypothetical protein